MMKSSRAISITLARPSRMNVGTVQPIIRLETGNTMCLSKSPKAARPVASLATSNMPDVGSQRVQTAKKRIIISPSQKTGIE
jgi:hypothetical protein